MPEQPKEIHYLEVLFYQWEKPRLIDPQGKDIKYGEWVLVQNENGLEIGKVVDTVRIKSSELKEKILPVLRIAELTDLQKIKDQQAQRTEILATCRQMIQKYQLPMKLVDCALTFDDKKITFAFTSDCRVDFRELVKELMRHYKRAIRLQQIGIRDEFKQLGGVGPCGRPLCCNRFLKDLGNITTDLARLQHIEHRGADRLSGACGRLKCCLNYESEGYRLMSEQMPPLGSIYKSREHGKGEVISWHILRHSINIRIDSETVIEEFIGCQNVKCSGCRSKQYLNHK